LKGLRAKDFLEELFGKEADVLSVPGVHDCDFRIITHYLNLFRLNPVNLERITHYEIPRQNLELRNLL
jgi:hypothetical protein